MATLCTFRCNTMYFKFAKHSASGNGKTWLANAFGVQACRQFKKVKYIRLPELIDELKVARFEADGSYRKLVNKYRKFELLLIDELCKASHKTNGYWMTCWKTT